ncbi:response regulator transcription factor [Legionella micdadei]|uniref:DNA-binding response regulator, OmpR family, contains REC and winged-helix (WHTH) domain n=1 Tax=Legionella micdadei TaxID=451 RepID=A0A098GBQ8_LEGMI|nr:response regulator transcription factor [Legionella micdadei]ARG98395.1 DNA-binding response regulator [Legionella micdadei]ARH01145.1 DNA-binding response regulator [Legionella micdadei]KTD30400.1 DNA-binding response regulator [Legionella micdadei]NSL18325.1 response regulator transcription factor [Legionella micdadei]CEG59924.1 putative response regulator [Legionella micdadei]
MLSHQKYLLLIDHSPWDNQLAEYFAKFDYKIIQLQSLSELEKETEQPAAVLINWILCKGEISIIDELYHRYPAPLIVISDHSDEETCVKMLEAGADDFLIKPLHPRELHARISAITRRVQRSTQETDQEKEVLLFADWRLYPASRQVFSNANQELQLSAGEYDLLLAFIRQPQRVLGREFLLQVTKNSDLNPFDRRIDVQISRLRQKIETDAKKPALIKTIRNGGYLFTARVISTKESETGESLEHLQ